MKLSELKKQVDHAHDNSRGEDLDVCIPNNKPAMGPLATTDIKAANAGIDWNRSKFLIFPEVEMIETPTLSQESLLLLIERHSKDLTSAEFEALAKNIANRLDFIRRYK